MPPVSMNPYTRSGTGMTASNRHVSPEETGSFFIEYVSEAAGYKLKEAEIKDDSLAVISEAPFDFPGLDAENIIAMEYFEDRYRLYIISRYTGNRGTDGAGSSDTGSMDAGIGNAGDTGAESGSDGNPARTAERTAMEDGIYLFEFLLRQDESEDMQPVCVNMVLTGLDADAGHDIAMEAAGDRIRVTDITGVGTDVRKEHYIYDGNGFSAILTDGGVSPGTCANWRNMHGKLPEVLRR